MSDPQLAELADLMRTLGKVQPLSAGAPPADQEGEDLFLAEAGRVPKDIAPIAGSSTASVSQTVHHAKKKGGKTDGQG